MILSKVGQKNNILSKYILDFNILLKELTSICLKMHFKTCRQPDCNSIIVHSKCSLKRPHSEVPFFFFLKVKAINIPIQWSIIADSRDHDHSVGGELPHLSIKQKKNAASQWGRKMTFSQRITFNYSFLFFCTGTAMGSHRGQRTRGVTLAFTETWMCLTVTTLTDTLIHLCDLQKALWMGKGTC